MPFFPSECISFSEKVTPHCARSHSSQGVHPTKLNQSPQMRNLSTTNEQRNGARLDNSPLAHLLQRKPYKA